jgi:hypothetical protein
MGLTTLMDRPKHKKLYYLPGIISLTVLPITFYFFALRELSHIDPRAIRIVWADTARMKANGLAYTKYKGHFPPLRNYADIVFTGNQHDDNTKLEFAQIRIREILKAGDTLNGIHFLFSDNSNYGTFVETLDRLQIEGAKYYIPLGNNLWFFHFQPDTTLNLLKMDCLRCNDVLVIEPEISWWTKTKASIYNIWKTSWQIIVLYCSFLISVLAFLRHKDN